VNDADGVRRTLHAYCRMLDERALDRITDIYAPDAVDDRKRGQPLQGHDEIRAYFQRSFGFIEYTTHILTNIDIEIDGPRATAYSRVTAYHWLSGGDRVRPADFVLLGSYDDELIGTNSGWRITRRVIGALGPAGLAAGELPDVFAGFGGTGRPGGAS
jgi:ketosteroid isomerase-like protein